MSTFEGGFKVYEPIVYNAKLRLRQCLFVQL